INRAGSAHSNSGTIDVSGGDLTITPSGAASFTSTGGITIGGGDTLTLSGGTFSYVGGTLNGPGGTLVLANVNPASFSQPHTLGSIVLTSSTASFALDQSTGTTGFSLASSTLNGPGTFTNAAGKTLRISNSTINT